MGEEKTDDEWSNVLSFIKSVSQGLIDQLI